MARLSCCELNPGGESSGDISLVLLTICAQEENCETTCTRVCDTLWSCASAVKSSVGLSVIDQNG
jgi:hypothetical protein